jgi:phage terminase large subunit-like protein
VNPPQGSVDELRLKIEKAALLEKKLREREELPHLYGWKWYPWARTFFESTNHYNFLVAANQISKALEDQTLIPTPSGFIPMGNLKVGDYVFGQDGKPAQVLDVPFKGKDECFEVTFDDGSSVIASKDHRWICKTSKERFRKNYKSRQREWDNPTFGSWVEKSTLELIESGGYAPTAKRPWDRVAIPIGKAVEYSGKKALFDPYLVGLLLGDGGFTSRSVIVTSSDPEISRYLVECHGAKKTGKYGYRLNGYQEFLRYLGLMGLGSKDKFIPQFYLTASVSERLELLQGLMDTDGTINKAAVCSFTTISSRLKDDIVQLVCSLGGKAKVKVRKTGYKKNGVFTPCQDAFHISIKILECPFKLPRKANKFYKTRYAHERVIYSIKPVGVRAATCITVDSSDGSFLCTDKYIVTHNSSTQIRKCIDWATNKKKWPKLWRTAPLQFWYLYPNKSTATVEWEKKWKTQFMPKGTMKEDPVYGWREEYKHKEVFAIHFNSGVSVYFKTYGQDVQDLQTGTVDAIFADEELPEEIYSEVNMRIAATEGYFHLVFTATLGLEMWRLTMEEKGHDELFKDALKLQVSMFDCLFYEDGTPSHWTKERIQKIINSCKSEAEVLRRVYGRFVVDGDLKYPGFIRAKNINRTVTPIEPSWHIFSGTDIGSGGTEAHPAAIAFIAVRPDFKFARVFKGWRGNGVVTTAGDVLQKHTEMKGNMVMTGQFYDWQSKDFHTISTRTGETFLPAEKSHDIGEQILNVLFKNGMLLIDDLPELKPLVTELVSLKKSTAKTKAKDDFCDALRYGVTRIPWDWTAITGAVIETTPDPYAKMGEEERARRGIESQTLEEQLSAFTPEEELDEFNELLES